MTKKEQKLEILALIDSLKAESITEEEYASGILQILNQPADAKFAATKNLGVKILEERRLIVVGQCAIPYNDETRSRQIRVATHLNENPEKEKEQRKFY